MSLLPLKRERAPLTNYADSLIPFIWDVADLLRQPQSAPEYRKLMAPMSVLRRPDPTEEKGARGKEKLKGQNPTLVDKRRSKGLTGR